MEVKPRLEIKDNKFTLPYLFEPEQYNKIKYMIESDKRFQELLSKKRVFTKIGDTAYRYYSTRGWFVDAFDGDLRLSNIIFDDGHKMIDVEFEFLNTNNGEIARKNIEVLCDNMVFTPVMMVSSYDKEIHVYGFAIIDLLCKAPMSKNKEFQEILFDVELKMEKDKKEIEELPVDKPKELTIINERKEYDRDVDAVVKFSIDDMHVFNRLFDEYYEEDDNKDFFKKLNVKVTYPKLSKYTKNNIITSDTLEFEIEAVFFNPMDKTVEVVIKDLTVEKFNEIYEHNDIICIIPIDLDKTKFELRHLIPMSNAQENIELEADINEHFAFDIECDNFDENNDTIYDYIYISQKGKTPVIAKYINHKFDKENKTLSLELNYSKEIFDKWLDEAKKLEVSVGFNAGTDRQCLATKIFHYIK